MVQKKKTNKYKTKCHIWHFISWESLWCACDKKPKRTLNLLKLYSLFYKKEVQGCVAPRVIGKFHEGLFTCHNPLSAGEGGGGRKSKGEHGPSSSRTFPKRDQDDCFHLIGQS